MCGKSAVASLPIVPDDDAKPPRQAIAWTRLSSSEWEGATIDRYVLRHSDRLEIPVLHVRRTDALAPPANPASAPCCRSACTVISSPPTGAVSSNSSTRDSMSYRSICVAPASRASLYKVNSELPEPKPTDEREIYAFPTGSVLANHVYNAQLIGRPYLVDALEDVEIVTRFAQHQLGCRTYRAYR